MKKKDIERLFNVKEDYLKYGFCEVKSFVDKSDIDNLLNNLETL